jgi:hypothetical protein
MTDMNIKSLRNFASDCINHYSTSKGNHTKLSVSDLPDIVRHEFASLIMSVEPAYATESTGCDNPLWESKMFPSLIRYLQNSSSIDESIEFKNTWTECVTNYMHSYMQELIDNELDDYNAEKLPARRITDKGYHHASI